MDIHSLIIVILYKILFASIKTVMIQQIDNSAYRGYPAKRALAAMRKHVR